MNVQPQILRANQVCQVVGLSRATIWRLQKQGKFPSSFQLGSRAVGWLRSDIDEWLESRPVATGEGRSRAEAGSSVL